MDANTLRVVRWLGDIRSAPRAAGLVTAERRGSIKTEPASLRSTAKFDPLSPTFFLAPSESKQDDFKSSAIQDGTELIPINYSDIYEHILDKPHARSTGHSEMARLRELGLVAAEDFDRASGTAIADSIDPDDSVSQREDLSQLAPRLIRQNSFYLRPELGEEEPATSNILDFYLNDPQKIAQGRTWTKYSNHDKNHDYKHATAPYLGETLKLSLVTSIEDEGEKLQTTNAADRANAEDPLVHDETHRQLIGLSSKPTRKISYDLDASEDTQAQKFIYEGVGTADPPNGPFKFQKPRLRRACPTLPPGKLLHGNQFDLTPSEASDDTAETSCTGDGKVLEMHETEGGRTPRFLDAALHASPRAVQAEGTFGRDGDIQVPIFPYTHLSTRCRALTCPIKGKHEKGPYLHGGKLRARDGNIFGSSNPPQKIWEAYDRIKDGDGRLGGKTKDSVAAKDVKLVTRFARHHFGEATAWGVGGSEDGYPTNGSGGA